MGRWEASSGSACMVQHLHASVAQSTVLNSEIRQISLRYMGSGLIIPIFAGSVIPKHQGQLYLAVYIENPELRVTWRMIAFSMVIAYDSRDRDSRAHIAGGDAGRMTAPPASLCCSHPQHIAVINVDMQ